MSRTRRRSSGSTLIELLVVIAIIAILAAILFPVFAKAREKARQSACLSNIKQVNLGIIMYMADYDQMVPMSATFCPRWYAGTGGLMYWPELVMPYIKSDQLFWCPSRPKPQKSSFTPSMWPDTYIYRWTHYGMNYLATGGPFASKSESAFANPASFVLLGEANGIRDAYWNEGVTTNLSDQQWGMYYIYCFPFYEMGGDPSDIGNYGPWDRLRHNDGLNLAFLDGHAKWYGWQKVIDTSLWRPDGQTRDPYDIFGP